MHHRAMQPWRMMAAQSSALAGLPLLLWRPWLPAPAQAAVRDLTRAFAAGAELVERCTRRFGKPEFVIPGLVERVAVEKPFCRLLHFVAPGGGEKPKVLLVAPMSGHHATLLRDTVTGLARDHEVFVTDWTDARMVPLAAGAFGFDDYIEYVMEFIRRIGFGCHVVAVCQAAPAVLAGVALMAGAGDPHCPSSMVLMGGPIDPAANPTMPVQMAASKPLSWFESNIIATVPGGYPGAGRRVYPGFIQLSGFMSMHMDRHIGEHLALFRHLVQGDGDSADAHRRFYDEYLSVMDLSADFYLETLRRVFRERALAVGSLTVRGVKVDPAAIRDTALLTIEGSRDDISGVGQTFAAHRLCSGLSEAQREHRLQQGVGHFGIFNGRRWREDILPAVTDFIARHHG
jgi:poly(3-hydroxybutyrate) depolymerase